MNAPVSSLQGECGGRVVAAVILCLAEGDEDADVVAEGGQILQLLEEPDRLRILLVVEFGVCLYPLGEPVHVRHPC